MRENRLLRRMRSGEPSYGVGLGIPSYAVAEALTRLGFHWCYIDCQHAPLSWEQAALMSAAIWASGGTPIIRVPWQGSDHIQRALDAGAGGVMVPVVNTATEAAAVVQAAKFPPQGIRSKGGSLHALGYATDPATYYASANGETVVIVQLETRESIAAAEEIMGVVGVDACLIGPNDLAASFGLPESEAWQHDDFRAALHEAAVACQRTGKVAGLGTRSVAMTHEWEPAGFRLFTVAQDFRLLQAAGEATAHDLGLA